MRLVATTVVRESIRGKQRTGYIYDVDWEAQEVLARLPIPEPSFPESDDNPRGGVRGGRGAAATSGGIAIANYDTVYLYDADWNIASSFSHPLFVGIHEIDWDGEQLWLAATGIDAVLKATLDGAVETVWDPHGPAHFELFGLRPRPHPVNGSVDYRTREAPLIDQCHINGVTRRNGATIVNCGLVRKRKSGTARFVRRIQSRLGRESHVNARRNAGRSMVLSIEDGTPRVLVELADHDFPTHNGQLLDDDRVVLNDSTQNAVRLFSLDGVSSVERSSLRIPGTWLRGLEPLDDARIFVGSAPATLMLIDLDKGAIEGRIKLSDDPNEAVHGLTLRP